MSRRVVDEASWGSEDAHVQSTTTRRPRPQAVGARGASHLPLRFSAKPSPCAPWARGYCRRSGNRGPQTCLPAACGVAQMGAQCSPASSAQAQDPREGPSLAGRTTGSFLKSSLIRQAREEAERSRRGTSRGARVASHDDRGRQAGASPRSVLLSSLVQRGQASRGVPRHQEKVAISVQRDQDQEDYETEVIVEPKTASSPELCAGEDYFCQGS